MARTLADIGLRYPRLIHAMQWVACLSSGEAEACIRDFQAGLPYSGEAVNHFGGTRAVIERASRASVRHFVADQRRHEIKQLRLAAIADQQINEILAEWRAI